MHSPMSTFLQAQWCFLRHLCQYVRQGPALPFIFLCLVVQLGQCMHRARIGEQVQSAVFCCPHTHGSPVFVVLPFYIQAQYLDCSPPTLPFFPLYRLYKCDGCPSSLLCESSWLGCHNLPAMGAVSSRS